MNKFLSVKLKVISFMLIVMIVFCHSQNIGKNLLPGNTLLNHGYSSFIQDFFSDGINSIAVPLFFAISGYLFFLKFEGTSAEFLSKYKKRLNTLAIPYLFWSIAVLFLFFTLQLISGSENLFGSKLIRDFSINELLNKIFINPIPSQFWFVRDLMVLVFLSPIIYWLIRLSKFYIVLILLFSWFFDFDFKVLSSASVLFFNFGAFLSINKYNIHKNDFSRNYWIYTSIWLILVFCRTVLLYINFQDTLILSILLKSSILIGILAVWSLYDFIFKKKDLSKYKFYSICSFSFFLYAFHIPTLNILKRVLFLLLGKDEFASLIIYITAPLLTISMGILIGYNIKRFTPKFYGIITGGR